MIYFDLKYTLIYDIISLVGGEKVLQIYLDTEFDAIKQNRKYHQAIISVGAVMCDRKGKYIDSFYTLSRPVQFQRLSPIVKKITGLKDKDILEAPRFSEVMEQFIIWLKKHNENEQMIFYAFGPDDRRTLLAENKRGELHYEKLFDSIVNLQDEISKHTYFHNKMLSNTLSLEDAKALYGVKGEVEHNALTDANDLYQLHQAYLANNLDLEEAQYIYKRNEKKEKIEEAKRFVAYQRKILSEFKNDMHRERKLTLYKLSIGMFHEWSKNDLQLSVLKTKELIEGQDLLFHIEKEGDAIYVVLTFVDKQSTIVKRCLITAKNKVYVNELLTHWKLSQTRYEESNYPVLKSKVSQQKAKR